MNVPAEEAIAACGARVLGADALPAMLHFATDTRTLAPGDAFVALRGERFDGHDYVREALARGASALVVDDPDVVPGGAPALLVENTTQAYLSFAGVARRHSRARVVAITGSAGKTTTKAFLAQILERTVEGSVFATPANENNEIGVAKLFLGLPAEAAYVVVEFGARHPGEIEPLARVAQPEVAVLTNIGEAHLEIMGSREQLAQTKWGIFATGGLRVLAADDAMSIEMAAAEDAPTLWFAAREAFAGAAAAPTGRSILLSGREQLVARADGIVHACETDVRVAGEHNLGNVAAAAAAAVALGVDLSAVAAALRTLELPKGRYERIVCGDFALLYDAYNASRSGMLATLASFARERATRRIAVLGSMAELGETAAAMHAEAGAAAASARVDVLLVGGDFAADLARGAREAGLAAAKIVPFASNAEALAWLRKEIRPDDLVLLKASRRYKFEEIRDGLRALAAPATIGRSAPFARRLPFAPVFVAIPVRTRLVAAGDDVARVVAAAVQGIAQAGDVVAVSETAVAIAQKRTIAAETIRPSRLAYALARRAGALATVNQPESMQLVIDGAGVPRVLLAALAQAAGRLVGRRGGFYRVLGESIATIDGYTGTLPPYERTIVLGPADPDGVAGEIARSTGAHAVIVDANDLGAAKILGASPGVLRERVSAALRENPHGNGDEQTPIVVLARRAPGAPLLVEYAA